MRDVAHQKFIVEKMKAGAKLIRRPGENGHQTQIWIESPPLAHRICRVYRDDFRSLIIKGALCLVETMYSYGVVELYELTERWRNAPSAAKGNTGREK